MIVIFLKEVPCKPSKIQDFEINNTIPYSCPLRHLEEVYDTMSVEFNTLKDAELIYKIYKGQPHIKNIYIKII